MTKPTDWDLEQLLEQLTKATYTWRMARGRIEGTRYWKSDDDPQLRSALTRYRNSLEEVRQTLERLGWEYRGADHDVNRSTEELLR